MPVAVGARRDEEPSTRGARAPLAPPPPPPLLQLPRRLVAAAGRARPPAMHRRK